VKDDDHDAITGGDCLLKNCPVNSSRTLNIPRGQFTMNFQILQEASPKEMRDDAVAFVITDITANSGHFDKLANGFNVAGETHSSKK